MNQKKPRRSRRTLLLVSLLLLVVVTASILYFVFNPKKAVKLIFPDLNQVSRLNSVIKQDSVFLRISMILQNKNPYKLSIDTFFFAVKLNDTSIARQAVPLNLRQSHFDVDTVEVPLNLDAKQIKAIIKHLQGTDSTGVELEGHVVYETLFGRTRLDFDKKVRIEVPIPPEIKVLKVERKSFNIKKRILEAVAHVSIRNRGKNLSLNLTDVHYDLLVKNTLHTSGRIPKDVTITPGSSIIVDIPMNIEVFHPLKTVWLIKTDNDRLDYTLHVKCGIRENISEKGLSSTAEIEASGKLELVK